MTTETFVKDIKPGLKNLNLIFIVLETGGYALLPSPTFTRLPGVASWEGRNTNLVLILSLRPYLFMCERDQSSTLLWHEVVLEMETDLWALKHAS